MQIKHFFKLILEHPGGCILSRLVQQGFIGSLSLRAASLGIGLGVSVLLARLLGPIDYGAYVLALTIMTLVAVPVHSGIAMLMVREVALTSTAGSWGRLRGGIKAANLAVLAAFTSVTGIVGLLYWFYPALLEGGMLWLWALLLLPFYCLAGLRGAALRGLQRPVLGQLPDAILRPALLAFALIFVSGLMRLDAENAMALHVAAAMCTFFIGAMWLRRLLPPEVSSTNAEYHFKFWLRAALPLTLLTGIQVINSSMAVLMLGMLASPADVGLYRIAELGSSLVLLGFTAGDSILAPQIAALHARGEHEVLQKKVTAMTRITLTVALPIVLLTTVFGETLLKLFFGSAYVAARWPLFVLSLGQLVNVGIGAVGSLLVMSGHERDAVFAIASATALNFMLCVLLIPVWGIVGAAGAGALSLVALNLAMLWRVWHKLGIRSGPWG